MPLAAKQLYDCCDMPIFVGSLVCEGGGAVGIVLGSLIDEDRPEALICVFWSDVSGVSFERREILSRLECA